MRNVRALARTVECWCGALVGGPCYGRTGQPRKSVHRWRIAKAENPHVQLPSERPEAAEAT